MGWPRRSCPWRRDCRVLTTPPSEPISAPLVLEPPSETPAERGEAKPKKAQRARLGGIALDVGGVLVRAEHLRRRGQWRR